jgi:hypothetical protein
MEREEYKAIMSDWVDESAELRRGFKALFASTTEGDMRYLFTLHYMVTAECIKRNIPEEIFNQAIPSIMASWFAAGKPEGMELLCLNGKDMREFVKMIRDMKGKPSSDA